MAAIDIGIIVSAVNNATAGIREVKGEVEGLGTSAQETSNRLKAIQVVLAGIAITKITELTKSFIETSSQVEVLQTRLALMTGNWKTAGQVLDEIISKYDKAGVSGEALANVFVQLTGVGVGDAQARALVDTIGKLNAATDRSPESIRSLGDALTKMAVKGTLDMRTLVTVLADQFPAGIRAAATASGAASVEAFTELARSGKITATQFMTYFQQGVNDKFGDIFSVTSGQLTTGLNRITTLWRDTIRQLNLDTGVSNEINERLNKIADAIKGLVDKVTVDQVKSFFDLLDNIGITSVKVAQGLAPIGPLIASMASAFASLLASLPPEALTLGIVGYLVFGRAGAAATIAVVAALDKLGIQIKSGFIQDIIGYMNSSEALGLGVAGYVMFGPLGAAALSIIGAKLASLRNEAKQLASGAGGGGVLPNGEPFGTAPIPQGGTDNIVQALKNVQTAMSNINAANGSVFDLINTKAKEAGLTVEQTAALIAHAKAESDLGKNLVGDNGHSFGLFQFNDKGELKALQDFAEKGGKDWMDFGTQIDFVIGRFKALGGASTTTADQASQVMNRFERFKDFLKNGDFGEESLARMRSANEILGQIAQKQQVPLQVNDALLNDTQKQKLDAIKDGLAAADKQAETLRSTLEDTGPERAAVQITGQYEVLKQTLVTNIQKLKDFRDTLGDQPTAQAAVTAELQKQQAIYDKLNGNQQTAVTREQAIAQFLRDQEMAQQRILQLKASEAELNLKVQYSNNAAFNLLAGTSGGQIAVQVEQQKLQLQQQILQYEVQIDQLEQQRLKTNDPALQASIDLTIQKYRQLAIATQQALANLSAEAVAQKQLWQSVGSALENGAVNAITALVMHTGTLKQVTLQMYTAITQAAAKYLIQLLMIQAIKPLLGGLGFGGGFSGLFSGLFAANGAVVPGGVQMFANGGIIGGPTLFGMAGEAGTEAVMPLENVGGKLGVRATGAGGDQYHVHLSAIDNQTGTEFLLKNLPTIQAGLTQRKNLNRGGRLGSP